MGPIQHDFGAQKDLGFAIEWGMDRFGVEGRNIESILKF